MLASATTRAEGRPVGLRSLVGRTGAEAAVRRHRAGRCAAIGTPAARPASVALEGGRKWVVQNYTDNKEVVVNTTDPGQAVMVVNCKNSVVQINGKVDAVLIDGCKRTGVVFDQVIATFELVNSSSMQVQCLGAVPTVTADKCDGVQLFIPEAVATGEFELVTSKSGGVNVSVVPADPAADPAEHVVPEQFVSKFKGGKLVTVPASHISE